MRLIESATALLRLNKGMLAALTEWSPLPRRWWPSCMGRAGVRPRGGRHQRDVGRGGERVSPIDAAELAALRAAAVSHCADADNIAEQLIAMGMLGSAYRFGLGLLVASEADGLLDGHSVGASPKRHGRSVEVYLARRSPEVVANSKGATAVIQAADAALAAALAEPAPTPSWSTPVAAGC